MKLKISKQIRTSLLLTTAIIVACATFVGAFKLGALLDRDKPEAQASQCTTEGHSTHTVTIQNDTVSPAATNAKRCDTLTIVNQDPKVRLLAFGQHDHHIAYNGVEEQELAQGQSLTITLDHAGSFLFHDHDQEEVIGTFTVRQ